MPTYRVVDISVGRQLYLGNNPKQAKEEARKHTHTRIYAQIGLEGAPVWVMVNKATLKPLKEQP